jgi:hypothetical protein
VQREEPLMRIITTPNEAHAVADAITHYIEYINHMPDAAEECEEVTELLTRFQKRLMLSLPQINEIPQIIR